MTIDLSFAEELADSMEELNDEQLLQVEGGAARTGITMVVLAW